MAKLFLESTDTIVPVSINGLQIFGATGTQTVSIGAGTTGVTVDGNVESVSLAGDISTYKFQQSGATLKIFATDGVTLVATVPVQDDANGTQLTIGAASFDVKVGATGMTVGTATVATTVGTISPTVPVVPVVPVTVTLTSATSVNEGTTATFTVKAAAAVTVDTPFTYIVPSNSSVDVSDFVGATSGTVTILKGSDTATFGINVFADNAPELGQNFDVVLKDFTSTTVATKNTLINDITTDKVAPVMDATVTSTKTLAVGSTNNIEYAEVQTVAGVIGKVTATDEVGGSGVVGFDIVSGDTNGYFDIDDATGNISLTAAGIAAGAASNDFETLPNSFTLGVVAYDNANNKSTVKNVIVGVTNVDDDAPVLQTVAPATANASTVVLNFNEALLTTSIPSSTDFIVYETVSGTTSVKTLSSSIPVGINGGAVVLTLNSPLTSGSTVSVSYVPGSNPLKDLAGNKATAIANQPVTTDTTAPTFSSSTPADDATSVAIASNIVLNFSETVKAGTGSIVLTDSTNNANTKTISVTDATQVTFSGSTLTINPTADLVAGDSYYVTMASGVVLDSIGNAFAGITSSAALNFGTTGAAATTGTTFTLTQGADSITGTAGDDTINGFLDGGASSYTSSLDFISAGAGTGDKLTAYGQSGTNTLTKVSGVEIFNIRASGVASFDMSGTSGYTSLKNEGSASAATLDFLNISSTAPLLSILGGSANTGFTFVPAAVASGSDSATINVDGYYNVTANTITPSVELVLSAGLETLTFNATGSKSAFLIATDGGTDGTVGADTQSYASATTKVAVNATAPLIIGNPFSAVKTVDLSGSSADVTIDLTGNTTATTVVGGSGNDTVTFTAAEISKVTGTADSINLAGGTNDVLALADATVGTDSTITYTTTLAAINSVVSNTEGLKIVNTTFGATAVANDLTILDISGYTNGIKNFIFADASASAGVDGSATIAITALTTANTLTFDETIGADASDNAVSIAGSTAGQVANIILTGATISGGAGGAGAAGGNAFTFGAGIDKVILTSNSDAASTTNIIQAGTDDAAGITAAFGANSASFDLLGSTDIIIRGADGGTAAVAPSAAFANAVNVNASTFSGLSTIYLSDSATGDVFTGGTSADKVYGLAGPDSLVGNAGGDSLQGGAAKDTLNGGDGDDVLVTGIYGVAGATDAASAESLTGGNGTDKFYIARPNVTNTSAANTDAAKYTVSDYNASGENLYFASVAASASTVIGTTFLDGDDTLTNLTWNSATGVVASAGKVINLGSLASDAGSTTVTGDLQAIFVATTAAAGKIATAATKADFIVAFNSVRDSGTYVVVVNESGDSAGYTAAEDTMTLVKLTGVAVADLAASDFKMYSADPF